ncbi:MAG TPA: amidase [Candidatus Binataceae bacterium]|nr:amidase [Candidatus Binataceae bacterium]
MANREQLLSFDVAALAEKFRARQLSPVEVTEAYLARIEDTEPRLHAYITVTAEAARKAARDAESEIAAGGWRGPFHGVPIALKDLCNTKGILTTSGSRVLADHVPDHDATVWTRLAAQGAVLLGKLNMHEFACGGTATTAWGTTLNPYDPERIPGGSSSGSAAAIVARSAAATIGSDTGGSIRIPAAFCGCVGLKQTWSRVSRYGVLPLSDSLDHAGPITRSVPDAALMLGAIAGYDPMDATSSREPVPDYTQSLGRDIKGVRVGVIRELRDGIDNEVATAFDAALKQLAALGAQIEEVSIPSIEAAAMVVLRIIWGEALEYHEEWIRTRTELYGKGVRRMLEMGMAMPVTAYIRAQRARPVLLGEAMRALERVDVLVSPSSGTPPAKINDARASATSAGLAQIIRFSGPFNATGQPAIAVPIGIGAGNAPLSFQIIGRPFDEMGILRVADAYERARGPLPAPNF